MKPVFGKDLQEWAEKRLYRTYPSCETIGFSDNDGVQAVAVYFNYRDFDVEIAFAADSPKWCSKGTLAMIFAYPFEQLNVERVTAVVARSNLRSRRLVQGLGFKPEGCLRKGLDGAEDALIYGMLKNECRWLYGRRSQ